MKGRHGMGGKARSIDLRIAYIACGGVYTHENRIE